MIVEQIAKRGGDPLNFIQIAALAEALHRLLIAHSANLLAHAIEGTYGTSTDVEVFEWAREIIRSLDREDFGNGGFSNRMN